MESGCPPRGPSRCPHCGDLSVVAQDIETLSDSALLVKLSNRIQLCCQSCGWMACRDVSLETDPDIGSGITKPADH